MKSKITIEVDFSNGNMPVIQILSRNSDDVRDNLLKSFLQNLHHASRWCRIIYDGQCGVWNDNNTPLSDDAGHRWKIETIKPDELKKEMGLMLRVIETEDRNTNKK